MKAGSMEGLIGASLNMKLSRTPMRVYKEAELKGDTEAMERAMGHMNVVIRHKRNLQKN